MTISELICWLEAAKAEHGDVPCFSSGEFIVPLEPEISEGGFLVGGPSDREWRFPRDKKAVLL